MISIIKDICIFMIIAQAVLFFVPGGTYMKYVRILVGVLIILRITEPLFGFLMDEGREEEIKGQIREWEAGMEYESYGLEIEDGSMGIYSGIEEELKEKLDECESGYQVKKVELVEGLNGEDMGIVITIAPEEGSNGIGGSGDIKSGEKIQIDPIVIGDAGLDDKTEENASDEEKKLMELKELYGNYIGADPEKMEIRYEGD